MSLDDVIGTVTKLRAWYPIYLGHFPLRGNNAKQKALPQIYINYIKRNKGNSPGYPTSG